MSFESISDQQLVTVSGGTCAIHGAGPVSNRIRGGAGLGGAGRGGAGAGADAGEGAGAGAAGGGCQSIIAALQNLLAQFGVGGLGGSAAGAGAGASPAAGPAEETSARPRGGAASAAGGCACGGG